jgi:hypothetical protein
MTNKRRSNNNSKLPTTASSSGSSTSASKNDTSSQKPPSRSRSPAQDVTRKRPRTEAENTMDQDRALAPNNSNASSSPASNISQNTAAPTSQVSAPNTSSSPSRPSPFAGSPDNFLNVSQHASGNNASSSEPKGKDKEVSFQQRATSPDASAATVQAATFRFYARASSNAVEGFNDKFKTNRDACDAVDRYFARFSSYGSRAQCSGANDNKRITIFFRTKSDMETATASTISELGNFHFHAFFPEDDRLDERTRSIFVTDIPLFITDAQLRGCFTRYGNITKCKVLKGRLYNKAIITFDSVNAVTTFLDTWSVLCCGYCLRVVPEESTKDSCELRRLHVALLASLPKNTVAADLVDIAESVNAKCINVPLSLNSYHPKPYAYLTFKDETVKEAAMDISCAFKGVSLTWHEPNQANSLCHICGRPNCSPDTCPKSNSR